VCVCVCVCVCVRVCARAYHTNSCGHRSVRVSVLKAIFIVQAPLAHLAWLGAFVRGRARREHLAEGLLVLAMVHLAPRVIACLNTINISNLACDANARGFFCFCVCVCACVRVLACACVCVCSVIVGGDNARYES